MQLHQNKEYFIEILLAAAEVNSLTPSQIEKDYYVSLILKEISLRLGDKIVFKGGTSLSKCYGVIQRFSEDIDIALRMDIGDHISTGERRNLKATLYDIINKTDMILLNDENVRSRRDHNIYIAKYSTVFPDDSDTPKNIIIETMLSYPPYPFQKMVVNNFISNLFLKDDTLMKKFDLYPFEMWVQALERTFVDKIFAICDYHLRKNYYRHSRHIYDVHMLWKSGKLDVNIINKILESVISDRQKRDDINMSSAPGTDLKSIMEEIVTKNLYKDDFERTTLLFIHHGKESYEGCMKSFIEIINAELLPHIIKNYK